MFEKVRFFPLILTNAQQLFHKCSAVEKGYRVNNDGLLGLRIGQQVRVGTRLTLKELTEHLEEEE